MPEEVKPEGAWYVVLEWVKRGSRASRVLRDMIGDGGLVGAETLLGQLSLSTEMYQSMRSRIDNARLPGIE